MAKTIAFEDMLGLQAALFEWADSYDSKARRLLPDGPDSIDDFHRIGNVSPNASRQH